MGQPAGASNTYGLVGLREDLEDIVYDISPMDTYCFTNFSKSTATATRHDWTRDSLVAASSTARMAEGDDFSALTVVASQKLSNYLQINRKDFVISRTADKVNKAGRKQETAYQTIRKSKELKRDIEAAILSGNTASAGTIASPRSSAGMEVWIYGDNHVLALQTTGSTTIPNGGLPTTAATDPTSVTAFVETGLKSALQQAWSMGADTDVILLGPTLKNKLDAFTGIATRFRNVEAGAQAQIVGAADVYVSSYGSHKVIMSRYCRASVVFCLDTTTWGLAWLDPIQKTTMAVSGDNTKTMIVGEWTLVCKTPEANTKLTQMN